MGPRLDLTDSHLSGLALGDGERAGQRRKAVRRAPPFSPRGEGEGKQSRIVTLLDLVCYSITTQISHARRYLVAMLQSWNWSACGGCMEVTICLGRMRRLLIVSLLLSIPCYYITVHLLPLKMPMQ